VQLVVVNRGISSGICGCSLDIIICSCCRLIQLFQLVLLGVLRVLLTTLGMVTTRTGDWLYRVTNGYTGRRCQVSKLARWVLEVVKILVAVCKCQLFRVLMMLGVRAEDIPHLPDSIQSGRLTYPVTWSRTPYISPLSPLSLKHPRSETAPQLPALMRVAEHHEAAYSEN
jgi:hypothetical protein